MIGRLPPSRRAHRVDHRPHVRPRPSADVLQIEHERVDVTKQTVGRRDRRHGVERMHREPAPLVDSALEILSVFSPTDAMLGREEPDERHSRRASRRAVQHVDVRDARGVHARLIRDERDALAANERADCPPTAR